jgi:membrane protease YdiL (CAAX protease family)
VLFAVSHNQLITLPALTVFGVVAGVLAVRTGRLGPSIFLHVGFNALTFFVLV